jgi:hypothetical protein
VARTERTSARCGELTTDLKLVNLNQFVYISDITLTQKYRDFLHKERRDHTVSYVFRPETTKLFQIVTHIFRVVVPNYARWIKLPLEMLPCCDTHFGNGYSMAY